MYTYTLYIQYTYMYLYTHTRIDHCTGQVDLRSRIWIEEFWVDASNPIGQRDREKSSLEKYSFHAWPQLQLQLFPGKGRNCPAYVNSEEYRSFPRKKVADRDPSCVTLLRLRLLFSFHLLLRPLLKEWFGAPPIRQSSAKPRRTDIIGAGMGVVGL